MSCCCFTANQAKVYASDGLEKEHEAALKAAEALLVANAEKKVTDMYILSAPVGHGAFAKVVECADKASFLHKFLVRFDSASKSCCSAAQNRCSTLLVLHNMI